MVESWSRRCLGAISLPFRPLKGKRTGTAALRSPTHHAKSA
jgi:hypothetical protein